MKKYLFPTLGIALLWGIAFLGQAPAGEATCGGTAGCGANCGNGCCQGCCDCCPRCGCKLEPVCQMTCETKKTTEHEYCCKCKDICIPGVTRIGERGEGCGSCDNSGACGACGTCNNGGNGGNGCQDCGDCRCRVRTVHKLMVCPVTKEKSVKACTVQWVCPNCSNCNNCGTTAPSVAPVAPAPAAPAPAPARKLPPPPKTTIHMTVPDDVRTAQAGF